VPDASLVLRDIHQDILLWTTQGSESSGFEGYFGGYNVYLHACYHVTASQVLCHNLIYFCRSWHYPFGIKIQFPGTNRAAANTSRGI
jgi:hypothetical protein